ncbi:uncharacterized protein LOC122498514 isoform X2 [Leptopilina heterotoma]|uniref:uncharacterized protein LOC122498514 isoform X2 n=1 Tax=Leptopilina heterotoma TaxID=63436 RepID=UPI001CA900BA|nr:uncharacterized protein LOC122498514 isoform X2 [Leptopilina heterotoma]
MKLFFVISIFLPLFYQISSGLNTNFDNNCPDNMKPIDNANKYGFEEYCDCEDYLLYNPEDEQCYDAYRTGPCSDGYYFMLPPGEIVAKCVKNPCLIDGLVPYKEQCHHLWKYGYPCKDNNTYLGIDDNFQVTCDDSKYLGTINSENSSKTCPENSYLFSRHYPSNYLCECEEKFLFVNRTCYAAYRQGPCQQGSYLIFPLEGSYPQCKSNPCKLDGLVPFNNGCYEINEYGPACPDRFDKLSAVGKMRELKCVFVLPGLVFKGIINAPAKVCPKGSRRVLLLGCKLALQ